MLEHSANPPGEHPKPTRLASLEQLERYGVLPAALVGLIARVVATSVLYDWSAAPLRGDDVSYVHYADVLLRTGQLESHHFPVGYPLLVALIFELTGRSFIAVRVVHVVVSALTIVVVSKVARALYGSRAAIVAAWITALYPPLIFMTGRVMSETVFIALLMLSLLQFLTSDRSGRLRASVLASALFAGAALLRSNLLPMLPFIPLWLWLRPQTSLRTRLTTVVATMAVAGAIVILPGLYFLVVKGEFIPSATNAGQTFYGANNPLADGGWVQVEDHPELLRSIPPEVRSSATAYSKAQFRLGMQWIRDNPAAFLRLLPKKFGDAWIPGFQSSETTTNASWAKWLLIAVTLPLMLGAILGWRLVPARERDGLLLAVLATYTLMSLAFYGNPRIGLFCSPILIVFASSLASRIGARSGERLDAV